MEAGSLSSRWGCYLLNFAVRILKRIHPPDSIFMTASTGLAACALNGTTLHSFSGVGLGDLAVENGNLPIHIQRYSVMQDDENKEKGRTAYERKQNRLWLWILTVGEENAQTGLCFKEMPWQICERLLCPCSP
eukprot:Gb_07248 [translate_table: standard]